MESGNINKIFQKLVFTLIAFFIFGASVNAEQITKTITTLDELKANIANDSETDVIKFGQDITSSEELTWYINGDKTLDLSGYTLTGTSEIIFKLNYNGDYTVKVIDSSNSKTSIITHDYEGTYGHIFQLSSTNSERNANKTLYIDGVNIKEVGNREARTIYNYKANNSNDSLVIKNSNIETIDLALWFSNYEFSNITLKASLVLKQARLINEGDTTTLVGSALGENQEIYYDKKITETSSYEKTVADTNEKLSNIFIENLANKDEHSIIIRQKQGLIMNEVKLNEIYNYSSGTPQEILISNNGGKDLQIVSVTVDDATKFTIVTGQNTTLKNNEVDKTWKIKANPGLSKGEYSATITLTDNENNTYRAQVTLIVEPKNLEDLGIAGINDSITYGENYEPSFTGILSLSQNDYKITYERKENDTYVVISEKPVDVGNYKITIKITNDNYVSASSSVYYKIVPKDISQTMSIEGINETYMYTGAKLDINGVLKDGENSLVKDKDYTLEYSDETDCTNVGKCKIIYKNIEGSNYYFTDKEITTSIMEELTKDNVTLTKTTYRLIEDGVTPDVVIKNKAGLTLIKDVDYEITYTNNKKVGTAYINITGKGYYITNDPIKIEFTIVEKETQELSFASKEVTKVYGDNDFSIKLTHTVGNGTITYKSSDTNVADIDASTGIVTIKSAGNALITATASSTNEYAEAKAEYQLVVNKKEISYTVTISDKTYDGNKNATIESLTFNDLINGELLEKDVDYTSAAEYEEQSAKINSNVTVNVELLDTDKTKNYSLLNKTQVVKSNIIAKSINALDITLDKDTFEFTGNEIMPNVTIKDGSNTLVKNADYKLEYTNNINVGRSSIKIIGIGNYIGEITKEFTINKKVIELDISSIDDVIYNKKEHTPDVNIKIKDTNIKLEKDIDYKLTYENNINAGKAVINIESISSSNYSFDKKTKEFNINKYTLKASDVTLEYTKTIYNGNYKEPTVTVSFNDEIISSSDYKVTYSDNKEVGTAKVTVTIDTENITGTIEKTFEIANKTNLVISGIESQKVTYTGMPVVLQGTLEVSNGINPDDITTKWYKDDIEIDKPTKVGIYKVVFSYEDEEYVGSKTISVEITKKESTLPELTIDKGVSQEKLSTIILPEGFKWVNEDDIILPGDNEYDATYTENNDTENYTTKNVKLNVYGKSKVNLNTSVNGNGGSISESKINLLEGSTETIILTPNEGYEIESLIINGIDKTNEVINNKIDITIENSDIEVIVTYKIITYEIIIDDVENAIIDPSGVIKVDYNTDKTFTIKANIGYKIVSVKVNDVEKINELINDELKLTNILENTKIVVVVERNMYEVIEGQNQKYVVSKSTEARFKIDVDYEKFIDGGKVYIDDILLDEENYTSMQGSTIITLKKEYVDKLSLGTHTLKVLFTDGEAITTFKVENIAQENPIDNTKTNEENPKTNDNIMTYITTSIISTVSLTSTIIYLKRKKQNN